VEETPALAYADLFAEISSDAPLKELESHISTLGTDGPGLSPNNPMAIVQMPIVQMPIVQVETHSFPDGRYFIKNRAADFFWNAGHNPITTVYFYSATMATAKTGVSILSYPGNDFVKVNEHSPIIQVFKR
jgi:phage terminase large subunit-like protein